MAMRFSFASCIIFCGTGALPSLVKKLLCKNSSTQFGARVIIFEQYDIKFKKELFSSITARSKIFIEIQWTRDNSNSDNSCFRLI